jgi:hypothetical protein
MFDLDNDGDLDIVTNDFNSAPQVLISDLAQRKRIQWLKIMLTGTTSNRNGLGAMGCRPAVRESETYPKVAHLLPEAGTASRTTMEM